MKVGEAWHFPSVEKIKFYKIFEIFGQVLKFPMIANDDSSRDSSAIRLKAQDEDFFDTLLL